MISQYYTLQTCVYKHTHYGMFSIFSPTLSTIHIVLKVRNPAVILNTSFPLILPHQTNHQIKSMLTYKYLSFSPHFYAHFTSLKQVSTMWITVHHLRLLLSLSPHPYIWIIANCLIFLKSHSCFLIKIFISSSSPTDKNKNCFPQIFMALHILFAYNVLFHPNNYPTFKTQPKHNLKSFPYFCHLLRGNNEFLFWSPLYLIRTLLCNFLHICVFHQSVNSLKTSVVGHLDGSVG